MSYRYCNKKYTEQNKCINYYQVFTSNYEVSIIGNKYDLKRL